MKQTTVRPNLTHPPPVPSQPLQDQPDSGAQSFQIYHQEIGKVVDYITTGDKGLIFVQNLQHANAMTPTIWVSKESL